LAILSGCAIALLGWQSPQQPKVAPGPNEPDLVKVLDAGFGLRLFDDLLNPVLGPVSTVEGCFRRAGPGPVTFAPLLAYGTEQVTRGGWYPRSPGKPPDRKPLWSYKFRLGANLLPPDAPPPPLLEGSITQFDPGDQLFGLWISNDNFDDGGVFSEPEVTAAVNQRLAAQPYKAMIYPMKDKATGKLVENALLIGWEYSTNDDFQDVMCRVDNVVLVAGPPVAP